MAKLVRLFRKLKKLRMLINALASSIVPVLNAFAILLLITTVYAVVATDLYREADPVHFANFSESLFSLFQMATGDSWGSIITRGLMTDERGDRLCVCVCVCLCVCVCARAGEYVCTHMRTRIQQKYHRSHAVVNTWCAFAHARARVHTNIHIKHTHNNKYTHHIATSCETPGRSGILPASISS